MEHILYPGNLANWNPSYLPDLELWLDAADAATITSGGGGAVSQWNDKSGNARHFIQPTGANQPITGTRSIGGLNAIDFDGANDTMYFATATISQPYTISAVILSDVAANNQKITSGQGLDAGNFRADLLTGFGNFILWSGGGPVIRGLAASMVGAARIAEAVGNGASSQIWQDGSQLGANGNAGGTGWGTTLYIASRFGGSNYFNGLFAEVIAFLGTTAADRQKVEGYLAWKWGLVANLPAGHPYKSAPPYV